MVSFSCWKSFAIALHFVCDSSAGDLINIIISWAVYVITDYDSRKWGFIFNLPLYLALSSKSPAGIFDVWIPSKCRGIITAALSPKSMKLMVFNCLQVLWSYLNAFFGCGNTEYGDSVKIDRRNGKMQVSRGQVELWTDFATGLLPHEQVRELVAGGHHRLSFSLLTNVF